MSIPGSSSPLFFQTATAGAAGTRTLQKSVRFNQVDSAGLYRNFSSAGNRRTWTFSCWIKKSGLYSANSYQTIFESGVAKGSVQFDSIDNLRVYDGQSGGATVEADSINMRDLSAWYHIVIKYDTTQSTATNRVVIYINGVDSTKKSATFPSQNYESAFSNNQNHYVGRGTSGNYLHGYLADVYFIDGTAHDATDFGEYDDNGVWQCKAFSGSFGSNGFHLFDFENESGVGNDASGNDNDFTVNNINASSGSTLSPSVYGNFASGSLAGAFDGSTASGDRIGVRPNGSGVSFTAQTVNTKLRVYCGVESGQGTLYINKTINTGEAPSRSSPSYVDVTSDLGTLPFTLTDVGFHGGGGGAGADIYAIEVDNTVLVNTSFTGDVLFDVPTNGDSSNDTGAGGEVSGNYCTWNPLVKPYAGAFVFKNGNMEAHNAASTYGVVMGTIPMSSGKWYWEVTVNGTPNNTYDYIGIVGADSGHAYPTLTTTMPNQLWYRAGGTKLNGSTSSSYGATYGDGDVIGVALDLDSSTKTLTFYKNGTSQGTAFSGSLLDKTWVCAVGDYSNALTTTSWNANWGQRAFAHNAPSGYKALCTTNLTTPTIADGSAHFESKLYTGNGSTNALTMSNSSMSPDWVWIHARSTTGDHEMFDIIRGANYVLESNSTNQSNSVSNTLTSFDSNGFTLGSSSLVNDNNVTYVAYAWDGGSSNATNTSGSVNSTVRANAAAGFSIVKWTGTGSAETVGHGLGAKPHFIISHRISGSGQWPTYNAEIGATKYMYFNSTIEARTYQHFWNNTEPTSSVFSIGNDADVSLNGGTHIAYCFAPVAGYQAMGKYEASGNSDGQVVYTDFKPALVMIKRISVAESWVFYDTSRDTHNPTVTRAWADLNYGDSTNTSHYIDILSNGFKVRSSGGLLGSSGHEYFYWAIAENPFQANGGLAR